MTLEIRSPVLIHQYGACVIHPVNFSKVQLFIQTTIKSNASTFHFLNQNRILQTLIDFVDSVPFITIWKSKLPDLFLCRCVHAFCINIFLEISIPFDLLFCTIETYEIVYILCSASQKIRSFIVKNDSVFVRIWRRKECLYQSKCWKSH